MERTGDVDVEEETDKVAVVVVSDAVVHPGTVVVCRAGGASEASSRSAEARE